MKDYIGGSSKPIIQETLCDKICRNITPNLCFKRNGKVIKISAITDKQLFEPSKGDYIFGNKDKHWNVCFYGEAQVSIPDENGFSSNNLRFEGYAIVNKEEQIEEISDILLK